MLCYLSYINNNPIQHIRELRSSQNLLNCHPLLKLSLHISLILLHNSHEFLQVVDEVRIYRDGNCGVECSHPTLSTTQSYSVAATGVESRGATPYQIGRR